MEKRILLLAVVVAAVCLCGSSFAMDPMGPPTASIKQGDFSYGAEWSYSDMELRRFVQGWSPADDQFNLVMHKGYVNVGYGIADNWDGFVRVGGAYLEWDRDADGYKAFSHDPLSLTVGGGFKTTVYEQSPTCQWGVLGQISWANYHGVAHRVDRSGPGEGNWQIRLLEFQVAAGPTIEIQDGLALYGGPFLYYASGRMGEHSYNQDTKVHKPIEELSPLGAYVGGQLDIDESTAISLECQYTSVAYTIAACIVLMQ